MDKIKLPLSLEQDLILHNYIYELFLNDIKIINYKKHNITNSFENYLIESLQDDDESILSINIYYLYHLILNDKIITNSSLNYLNTKNNDLLAELFGDILNILPLCSQIYLLMERKNHTDLNTKLFVLHKLCKMMYLLGQEIVSLYIKDGEFIKEIRNAYIELIKRQIRSEIESKMISIHNELKNIKQFIIDKELVVFDIIGDLKKILFNKYYTDKEKDKTNLVKLSLQPFIYWKDNRNNLMSNMNLKFMKKLSGFEKEINELQNIERISTSLIFFFEYEEFFWKSKANNTISLNFFMDKDDLMKYSFITKNDDDFKDFLKRYYNYVSLESFIFKKNMKSFFEDSNKNIENLVLLMQHIHKKLPSLIDENLYIIPMKEHKEIENMLAMKLFEIFSDTIEVN